MIVVTCEFVSGQEVTEVLGLVKGSTTRARHVGRDLTAFFRNVVGGEVIEYTKLLAESREQAHDRLVEAARALGADAVIGVQFSSSQISAGVAEILIYGTAVKLREKA